MFEPSELVERMNELRMMIGSVCCCYFEGDDDFKDMSHLVDKLRDFFPELE